MAYYHQGPPITQIAKQVHLVRGTIYKYQAAECFPGRAPRAAAPGTGKLLAPYTAYLRKRCEDGCQNAQQLAREIQAQGFSSNPRTVLRWLQAQGLFPHRYELGKVGDSWEQLGGNESQSRSDGEEGTQVPVPTAIELTASVEPAEPLASARQLSYLLVKALERLEAKEQRFLALLQQEQEVELAYRLSQHLIDLLKNKQGDTATAWISICSSCGMAELEALALGLQKELPAFQAACSLPYSNGMTEGFVNKLKYIKRSMYGWGNFELCANGCSNLRRS